MIPFINLGMTKQKLYVIPEGSDEIYALLQNDLDLSKEMSKLDIETTSTQMNLMLKNSSYKYSYSYQTNSYLATQNIDIYTKITTISPQYVILNQTSNTLIIEQSELPAGFNQTNDHYFPIILEPGTR